MKPISFDDLKNRGSIEICCVQGKPYMFTNLRIDRKSLPEGFYGYDVRDDCDGECWEFAPNIFVNHWGTIIGKAPLVLDELKTFIADPEPENKEASSEGWFFGESVENEIEYLDNYNRYLDFFYNIPEDIYTLSDSGCELCIHDSQLMVMFDNIGEGLCGDYDPEDPNDINLLRFYAYYRVSPATSDTSWEYVEDSSYCTQVAADVELYKKISYLKTIFNRYKDAIDGYPDISLKKIGEELSYIGG